MADVATHSSHLDRMPFSATHTCIACIRIHIDTTVLLLTNRYPVQIAPLVRVHDPKCIAALWDSNRHNARRQLSVPRGFM